MSTNVHQGEVELILADEIHQLRYRASDLARCDQFLAERGYAGGTFDALSRAGLNLFLLASVVYHGLLHEGIRKITPAYILELIDKDERPRGELLQYINRQLLEALGPWLEFRKSGDASPNP